jgi:apolipoprotein N-acyltransferase
MRFNPHSNFFNFLLCLFSAISINFCFSQEIDKLHQPWLVWVCLIPIYIILFKNSSPSFFSSNLKIKWHQKVPPAFFWGGVTGLLCYIPNLAWLRHSSRVLAGASNHEWAGIQAELTGALACIGLGSYLALYFSLWSWLTAKYAKPNESLLFYGTRWQSTLTSLKSAALTAIIWTGLEWLRSILLTGFSWNGFGVPLYPYKALIQIADIIGVLGLSFIPVFLSCITFHFACRLWINLKDPYSTKTRMDFTIALILLCSLCFYGLTKINQPLTAPETLNVLALQPNQNQQDKWNQKLAEQMYQDLDQLLAMYLKRSEFTKNHPFFLTTPSTIKNSSFDLVVMPESAIPDTYLPSEFQNYFFKQWLTKPNLSILFGSDTHQPSHYNQITAYVSAILLNSEGEQIYNKQHLVPFGEYLPLRNYPPFHWLNQILPYDYTQGKSSTPFQIKNSKGDTLQLIPLICFEDTDGQLARQFITTQPQLLVNITNDAWFLKSNLVEIHLINALFRTIELRRPLIRSANTGVTCWINEKGYIQSQLKDPSTGDPFVRGCLPMQVKYDTQPPITLYALYGDWFAIFCLIIFILHMIKCYFQTPNAKKSHS